jgi:hypothetical protein
MASRFKTIFSSTVGILRFERCIPTQCNLFFWNALFSRLVACPTSRIMSFHSTRHIFVPIVSPATTTVLHRSSLRLRRIFRPSHRIWRDRPGAVKPAPLPVHTIPYTTTGFPTRISSSPQDSAAPDESSNSSFIDGVHRSSGTGEEFSKEETQAHVDYDRKSQARVDYAGYDHVLTTITVDALRQQRCASIQTRHLVRLVPLRSRRLPSSIDRIISIHCAPTQPRATAPTQPRATMLVPAKTPVIKVLQVSNGRASCAKSVVSDF